MKNWLIKPALAVFTLLVFAFAGCAGEETVLPDDADQASSADAPAIADSFTPEDWLADGVIADDEYSDMVEYAGFEVYYATDDDHLYLAMKAETEGWLSVGFTMSGAMKNADLIFAMVEAGTVVISDQYSSGTYGPHAPDTDLGGTGDILEYGGAETNGTSVIEFKRLLDTGDEQDLVFNPDVVTLIMAYGSADDFSRKHEFRGAILLVDP